MSINFSFNFIFNFRAGLLSLQMLLRQVGKEGQLGSIRSKLNKSVLSNLLRERELDMDLIKGSSQMINSLARFSQSQVFFVVLNAFLVFFRFSNKLGHLI